MRSDDNPCLAALADWSAAWPGVERRPLAVAYSGGADSTALLLAVRQTHPGSLWAFHVNHGLQAAALDFERQVRRTCHQHAIPLQVAHTSIERLPGQSLEAVARDARYAALIDLANAHGVQHVLLAQHADDQVESVMLAWLRGAGLRGLSGMVQDGQRGGVHFHRPILHLSAAQIRQWLIQHRIDYVDDPTNQDVRHKRNALRHLLTPILERLEPAYRTTVLRSARHLEQAQRLLDERAAEDLQDAGSPPRIQVLQRLSDDRLHNALRFWLWREYAVSPSTAQLHQVCRQLRACTTRGHQISLRVGKGHLVRDGAFIQYLP